MRKQNVRAWIVAAVVTVMGLGLCGQQVARAADEEDSGPSEKIYQQTAHSFVVVTTISRSATAPT